MYGLLLEAIYDYVRTHHSEETWAQILNKAHLDHSSFVTHEEYPESTLPLISKATSEITCCPLEETMDNYGVHFVSFVSKYGYDTILRVLGRNMRDFLNGLDNLHEYLRLSYPKMRAPSFSCDNETRHGLLLHYRTKRHGFIHYVMGQIRQVGLLFYDTQVEIELLKREINNSMEHVVMKLHFDNKGFELQKKKPKNEITSLQMKPEFLFRMFPFHIVFGRDMVIRSIGNSLKAVLPQVMKKRVDHVFQLAKPPLEFAFSNVSTGCDVDTLK